MPVKVSCPKCKSPFPIEEEMRGGKIACPECGAQLNVRARSSASQETPIPDRSTFVGNKVKQKVPVVPEIIGRYKILKQIGKGAMGCVYLAQDTQLGRNVALKVPFFPEEGAEDAIQRFFQEARIAATLHHPNICPIFDIGVQDDIHFLTMAYIEGETLADILKREGAFPERKAATLIQKLAAALQEAHDVGIVHRDLKPANIMINPKQEPIVMDFGVARQMEEENSRLTQAGMLIGSPAYMSPEQVSGNLDAVGPRSDLYSLGVIFYELLTGRRPFEGPTTAVLVHVMTQDPPLPTALRPDLDRRLEMIVLQAMAKQESQRYESMEKLARILGVYLNTIPTVRPASEPIPSVLPVKPVSQTSVVPPPLPPTPLESDVMVLDPIEDAPAPQTMVPGTAPQTTVPGTAKQPTFYEKCLEVVLKGKSLKPILERFAPNRFDRWQAAAKRGNLQYQHLVGLCYSLGTGVALGVSYAVWWFQRAASKGFAPAQCSLGECYERGKGVEKDATEAVRWYQSAAEQGYPVGQRLLGLCYQNGVGVDQSPEQAAGWYRKAAERGDIPAHDHLGWCYENGTGVEKDVVEAVRWYRKAAERGDASAQTNLGLCYLNGSGVIKDAGHALQWFQKAAAQGLPRAQNQMGQCLINGVGMEKDVAKAIEFFQIAAAQGDADAQTNLGRCYENGTGVTKSVTEALRWYRLASQTGNEDAKKGLKRLGVSY